MTRVLRQRLQKLVHGDDGAALVVTLALFMMMYIACAGVFAIGQTVKEKVILQNAADAAAYSAAVVQADTLSRIATINRAMAWAYKSMVCRQMDYITWKWIDRSCELWENDSPTRNPACETIGAYGVGNTIGLSGDVPPETYARLRNGIFRAGKGLMTESKIDELRDTIAEMNAAIWDELIPKMRDEMVAAAEAAVKANLPGYLGDRCVMKTNMEDVDAFVRHMRGDEEDRFLAFADLDSSEFRRWFPLGSITGFSRSYGGPLRSFWVWIDKLGIPHPNGRDAGAFRDGYYDGRRADPCVLTEDYYDNGGVAKGAFSVAVAKKNENPWKNLVVTVAKGLYSVFDPAQATEWTWAASSAQAAWREFRPSDSDLAYSLDYEEHVGSENLRTDDWDAVFVPVRKALTTGKFASMMTQTAEWKPVAGYAGGYSVTDGIPLPQMHNSNGSISNLDWGSLLDIMYH